MSSELYDQLIWLWQNRKFKRSPFVFVCGNPQPQYRGRQRSLRRFRRTWRYPFPYPGFSVSKYVADVFTKELMANPNYKTGKFSIALD